MTFLVCPPLALTLDPVLVLARLLKLDVEECLAILTAISVVQVVARGRLCPSWYIHLALKNEGVDCTNGF